jgi:hypothetical protein
LPAVPANEKLVKFLCPLLRREYRTRGDVEENGFSLAVPVVSFAKWRYYFGTEIEPCGIGLRDSITSRFVYWFQRSLPLWAFASSLRFGMSETSRANASRTAQLISPPVEDREAKQTQDANHVGHGQPYVGMSSPALWASLDSRIFLRILSPQNAERLVLSIPG